MLGAHAPAAARPARRGADAGGRAARAPARYELAFGADAPRALAEQGHAYLSSLTPWIVLLAALALGASLGALAQRWADGGARGAPAASPRLAALRVWLLASAALVAIFAGQELLEGCFAGGHAAGVAAVLGGGGWWALPAALVVGGLLTLALRAGARVEEALAELAPLRLRLRSGRACARAVRPARRRCSRARRSRAPPPVARRRLAAPHQPCPRSARDDRVSRRSAATPFDPPRSPMSRIRKARPAGGAAAAALAAVPAAAHEGDPHYRSVVTSIVAADRRPQRPGARPRRRAAARQQERQRRVVLDLHGKPYARLLADGTVQVNAHSSLAVRRERAAEPARRGRQRRRARSTRA